MASTQNTPDQTSEVLYREDGAVAVITLNRPEKYNAVNDGIISGLNDGLDRAAANPQIRAVIMHGSGPGFCAGADLSLFAGVTPELGREYILTQYRPLMLKFRSLPKPIIAAIHGSAAGVGCALALACDLRVMEKRANIRYAFINIALGPDGGAGWLLARAVGYSRAMEIACSGEKFDAARCLEIGITNRIAAEGEVLSAAMEWARQLAAKAPIALAVTKAGLQFALDHGLEETIEFEADQQMKALGSEDLREGISAFFARRPPRFTGK